MSYRSYHFLPYLTRYYGILQSIAVSYSILPYLIVPPYLALSYPLLPYLTLSQILLHHLKFTVEKMYLSAPDNEYPDGVERASIPKFILQMFNQDGAKLGRLVT